MSESKSKLEIVLMPVAVAVVGIFGSLIISIYQAENASKLADAQAQAAIQKADADRQIKVLEIFSNKITGNDAQREIALKFLRALDSNLHEKLANAVAESEPEGSWIGELALNEKAIAVQRRVVEESARAKSKDPEAIRVEKSSICEKYNKYTSEEWEKKFLQRTRPGSWHVFVASLGKGVDASEADRVAQDFNIRFPNHMFRTMPTVSNSGKENYRNAIIIAEGLTNEATAREIAIYADRCGIANGAYPYRQPF